MTKDEMRVSEILKELNAIKEEKREEKLAMERIISLRKNLSGTYQKFLDSQIQNKPNIFVQIKKFPTAQEIRSSYEYGNVGMNNIPLYEYGWFDIKELVAIIKVLYSLKRDREYNILTFANLKKIYNGPELYDKTIESEMNFIIGDDRKISFLEDFNGKYFPSDVFDEELFKDFYNPNVFRKTRLSQISSSKEKGLGITLDDDKEFMEYYDYLYNGDKFRKIVGFPRFYNIFDKGVRNVIKKLEREPNIGVAGLLSFPLGIQDNFIAKTLLSIVIYKKKLNKMYLDNEDYKYIFYELFKESNIDINDVIDKEIPKKLERSRLK